MKKHIISAVQYIERSPKEEHYLYIYEKDNEYEFVAGEVIGQGFGAGGGEGTFDVKGLLSMKHYSKLLNNINCQWIDEILRDDSLSTNEKYIKIIQKKDGI